MLYQLSYARARPARRRAPQSGGGRIRTFVALSAAAYAPPRAFRRVLDFHAPRRKLGPDGVGSLEILGLTGLGPRCDSVVDPPRQVGIELPRGRQNIEQLGHPFERGQATRLSSRRLRLIELAIGPAHEIEQDRHGARSVQIIVHRSSEIILHRCREVHERSVPVPVPSSLFPFQTLMEFAESSYAFLRRFECGVGEIHGLAVMRLKKEQPDRSGIDALLSQIARGEKIAVALRHLGATDVQKLTV